MHLAGTESATVWCGFMNGAVQAGQRAAIEVLYDLRPQLVTAHDLSSIKCKRKQRKQPSSLRKKLIKLTISIGVVALVTMAVRKVVLPLTR